MMRWRRWRPLSHYRGVRRPQPRAPISDHPLLLTLAVAAVVSFSVIHLLEAKLRPTVVDIAAAQVQNTMTAVIETAVSQDLSARQVSYGDMVEIHRDSSGAITSLTTDMAQMNLLRVELTAAILRALEGVDVSTIQIPLGSLLDFEPLWARGPSLKARAMTVGTVTAEFESELTSAGVNQTLHRVCLEVSVPLTVLLPGGEVQLPVRTSLVVAETVIVGKVPDTYLSLDGSIKDQEVYQ